MKLLNKLFTKSGKIALTAMQTLGLTAVVGVAGVAAYQFLGTSDDNTAFLPSAYNNTGEVVYVSHANTGSYQRGNYTTDKVTGETSVQVSANTLKYLNSAEQREQMAQAMEEQSKQAQTAAAPETGKAYTFGATEGLGVGTNAAREEMLKNNPMAAQMQQSLGGMKDMIASAQQNVQAVQAAAEGKGAEVAGAAAKGGALGAASHDWSGKFGSGSAGGAGSSFVMQNSGKNVKAGEAAIAEAQNSIDSLQLEATQMLEGKRLQGRAKFGRTDGFGKDKDGFVAGGRTTDKGSRELDWITKRTTKVAANKSRAANEAGWAYQGSEQISGSITFEDGYRTGEGQSSKDFSGEIEAGISAIKGPLSQGGDIYEENEKRAKERKGLIALMYITAGAVGILVPIIAAFTTAAWSVLPIIPYGPAAAALLFGSAAVLSAIALSFITALAIYAGVYQAHWGGNSLSNACYILGGVLTALAGLAWIPAAASWISSFSPWITATLGALLGVGGASFAHSQGVAKEFTGGTNK